MLYNEVELVKYYLVNINKNYVKRRIPLKL